MHSPRGYDTITGESPVNGEQRHDSSLNTSNPIEQSGSDGKTPSITSLVMMIMAVLVVLVAPATILEITQDIRETKDQYLSDYMYFGLTILTLFVMFIVQILSCKCGRGLTETATLSQSIPRWKVVLYLFMGIPAIISFIEMCRVARDNEAEFCMQMSRLIFVIVQYIVFLRFIKLKCLNCDIRVPKPLCLYYVQIAIAIASNVAICIDLIIEDDREEQRNDWTAYTYPFRFEFMLFSISMWLDFFPKYESEDDSHSIQSDDSFEDVNEQKHPVILSVNFFLSHAVFVFYVVVEFYDWLKKCNSFKNIPSTINNVSNTTNTTSDNLNDKTSFMVTNIFLFVLIISFEGYILVKIWFNPPNTPSAMHRSLKPNEVLLIVCALSFNVYQVAIIIPDIYFLANNSHDHQFYNFTVAEVIESCIAIIYIFVQAALILQLTRLKHNEIGFNIFAYAPIYYPALAINMVIWLLSCFEKLNACIEWESSTKYKHYWHMLQNSIFPVGIFFQWHSGELLFEIGFELQLFRIYKHIWYYLVWRPIFKRFQRLRNYICGSNTI